jgi:uncharacterized protein YjbJ (UPF0337 family)
MKDLHKPKHAKGRSTDNTTEELGEATDHPHTELEGKENRTSTEAKQAERLR